MTWKRYTPEQIIRKLREAELLISHGMTAIKLMAERDSGVEAMADDDRMMGIFTERDYAGCLLLEGRSGETEIGIGCDRYGAVGSQLRDLP